MATCSSSELRRCVARLSADGRFGRCDSVGLPPARWHAPTGRDAGPAAGRGGQGRRTAPRRSRCCRSRRRSEQRRSRRHDGAALGGQEQRRDARRPAAAGRGEAACRRTGTGSRRSRSPARAEAPPMVERLLKAGVSANATGPSARRRCTPARTRETPRGRARAASPPARPSIPATAGAARRR